MLPIELDAQQQETALTLRLQVPGDLLWFQGHFPTLPIYLAWRNSIGCSITG